MPEKGHPAFGRAKAQAPHPALGTDHDAEGLVAVLAEADERPVGAQRGAPHTAAAGVAVLVDGIDRGEVVVRCPACAELPVLTAGDLSLGYHGDVRWPHPAILARHR